MYVQRIAEWLVGSGWDVRMATTVAHDLEYFWDAGYRRVAAPRDEDVSGVQVQRLPIRHWPGGGITFGAVRRAMGEATRFVNVPGPFRLASRHFPRLPGLQSGLLDDGVPDLIIATNLGLEGLAVQALGVARQLSVPLVLVPFAHLGEGASSDARRYVSMPHHRELLAAASLVLTMTDLERQFAIDCGANPSTVVTVGAGVTLEDVTGGDGRRVKLAVGLRSFLVGSIGALADDKGSCDLIEAARILREDGVPIELVLAGPALGSFERWLRGMGANGWPWLHLPGVIDEKAKRDLLDAMDVFALPSRTESFGIVFLEAWANRKPVVAAGVGAVREVVRDRVDGILVPFGDTQAIAAALRYLFESQTERHRLGSAGYEKTRSRFTWTRVLSRVERAFSDVLGIAVC